MKNIIGMDVGGTKIKASVISPSGKLLADIKIYDSYSRQSKDAIIDNFMAIIKHTAINSGLQDISFSGIGMAFPGPFDYEKGISYIKGLNKYESLYGVNIGKELKAKIENDKDLEKYFSQDFEIKFANDGDLFAWGEYVNGGARGSGKAVCICIGTGAGSAFLDNGRLIKCREDVPEDGWIFHVPYGTGIVDDYISARGILSLCGKYEELKNINDVRILYDLASAGNCTSKKVFCEFGKILSDIMVSFFDIFKPDTFVMGGQISKSHMFFEEDIQKECVKRGIKYYVTQDTSISILTGVSGLF